MMTKDEAMWIAISALNWVIAQCEKEPQTEAMVEHIAEKREALAILTSELVF